MNAIAVMTQEQLRDIVADAYAEGVRRASAVLLPKTLARADVAERYGISISTLRREILAGKKPHPDQGERWSRVALDRWDEDRL